MKQRTREWLELRQKYVGSSDAPAIMGVSPWKTATDIYHDKISTIPSEFSICSWMQRGIDLEPQALEKFEELTGYLMLPDKILFNPKIDFIMSSLDGLEVNGKAIVEIKCPGKKDHEMALDGQVPEKYMPQLQHQMLTTGLQKVYYFSYAVTSWKILEVYFDEEYANNLLKKEKEFWDCVINKTEPEMSNKDYILMDSPEWNNAAQEWKTIQQQIKELESRQKEVKDRLLTIASGRPSKGYNVTVSRTIKKGAIDYAKVPELDGVDLDAYRKDSREEWGVRVQ